MITIKVWLLGMIYVLEGSVVAMQAKNDADWSEFL
jgi:hypothetical protein